jgi:hypothetical protein
MRIKRLSSSSKTNSVPLNETDRSFSHPSSQALSAVARSGWVGAVSGGAPGSPGRRPSTETISSPCVQSPTAIITRSASKSPALLPVAQRKPVTFFLPLSWDRAPCAPADCTSRGRARATPSSTSTQEQPSMKDSYHAINCSATVLSAIALRTNSGSTAAPY